MRRFRVLVPLEVIEFEDDDVDESEIFAAGRQLLADRAWGDWIVSEVRDSHDRYAIEQRSDGWYVVLHELDRQLFGPFASKERAEGIADFVVPPHGEVVTDYANPDYRRFVADMEAAGLEVEHHRGRFGWEGPAVRVADLQDALGATQVQCQVDTMGKGYIVYPHAYGHRFQGGN